MRRVLNFLSAYHIVTMSLFQNVSPQHITAAIHVATLDSVRLGSPGCIVQIRLQNRSRLGRRAAVLRRRQRLERGLARGRHLGRPVVKPPFIRRRQST